MPVLCLVTSRLKEDHLCHGGQERFWIEKAASGAGHKADLLVTVGLVKCFFYTAVFCHHFSLPVFPAQPVPVLKKIRGIRAKMGLMGRPLAWQAWGLEVKPQKI